MAENDIIGIQKHLMDPTAVKEAIDVINDACEHLDPLAVMVACLGIVLYINNPDITTEELHEGIKDVSAYIATNAIPDDPESGMVN